MFHTKNATRFVAILALLVGFAFAVPPASAAEESPEAEQTASADPCFPFTYEGETGPVSYRITGCGDVDVGTASTQTIPPCASNPEVSAGPATVGLDPYCNPYAEAPLDLVPPGEEDPTERCDVTTTEDPKLVLLTCELSTTDSSQNCLRIYWKHQVGPLVWEQRSSCDGDIYIEDGWQP